MEGFKSFKKIQCFKEGGSVAYKSRKAGKEQMHEDEVEDKKLIKKAFKQHDEAEHDKSNASEIKLKKGGRSKKEVGSVKKYKAGGKIENVYEAKKKAGDLDRIEKVKETKAAKLCGGGAMKTGGMVKSKESGKCADSKSGAKEMPNKYKKSGKIKKFDDGGLTQALVNAGVAGGLGKAGLARAQEMERKRIRDKYLGPSQQAELASQQAQATAAQPANASAMAAAPAQDQMGNPTGMKKGGKSKK